MKGLKKCCTSDEMDMWEDEEEGGNIGSECEAEDWNCEDSEAEKDCRNGDWSETGEAE